MKLKVTAKSKEQDTAGKSLYSHSMLYILCFMLFALYALLLVPYSYCDTSTNVMPDESSLQRPAVDVQGRPCIVSAINPVYLPKTTKLEITSDRPLKIKQMKLSEGGVLRIEAFNATTSLPDSISIDKGILRGVAFETEGNELRIFVSLTEPVIYDIESTDKGLVVVLQNPVLEQLVSLNINDESLSTVLLMLFIEYGANIVAGSKVSGKVTAHLVDVPLKAALDEILEAEGFGYIEDGGLIRVMPAAEIQSMDITDITPSLISMAPSTPGSEVFELTYASVSEIQPTLQKLIAAEGTVIADQRTNSVIVVASSRDIEKIRGIIEQLDKEISEERATVIEDISPTGEPLEPEAPPAPQIVKKVFKLNYLSPEKASALLQPLLSPVGIVEIVKEETGTGGAGGGAGGGGSSGGAAGGGLELGEAVGKGGYIVVSDTLENIERIEEEISGLDAPTPQVEIEAYIVEGSLSDDTSLGVDWTAINEDEELGFSFLQDMGGVLTKGIITPEKFQGILSALSNTSELNVLSNPRITTLEDQPAVFHSGDKIPFNRIVIQEGIEQIDTVFEDVGIILSATPQVKENGMVSLLLGTSVSNEGGFTPSGQPRISTRTTTSQVLVRSGDTAVIAGLISEKASLVVSKVPILGDIPLIGRVFSTQRELKQKNEITIFITPRIISGIE
ncbi:secretin N-terminal domain-containing protein [Candidatus Poribacteria bacterium]